MQAATSIDNREVLCEASISLIDDMLGHRPRRIERDDHHRSLDADALAVIMGRTGVAHDQEGIVVPVG